ncbi:hypothetical protein D9M71_406420 [compost metagenome]
MLDVELEDLLQRAFLAGIGGHRLGKGHGGSPWVGNDVAHALQGCLDRAANDIRVILDRVVGGEDRLGHAFENLRLRYQLDLQPGFFGVDHPVRHTGHRLGFVGREQLPDTGRAGGLDVHIVLAQASFAQGGEQGVVGGVRVGHHRHGLALEVADGVDVLLGIGGDHGHAAGTQHRDRAHRNPVGPHHDRGITQGTAEHGVTGADLFCHVHATLGGDELHVQVLGGVVTLLLRDDPRSESRQVRWRRQQVSHVGRLRLGGEGHAQAERDGGDLAEALKQGLEHAYS